MKEKSSFFQTNFTMNKILTEYWLGLVTGVAGWAWSLFVPILPFLAAVFVLTIFDAITGVRAAKKRSEPITSKGFRRTSEKLFFYTIALTASELFRTTFFVHGSMTIPLSYIIAMAIATTEFKSNIENIETITGVKIWGSIKEYFQRQKGN